MAPRTASATKKAESTAKAKAPGGSDEDLIDRLIADWHRERPDLDPDPMAIVGRLLRVGRRLGSRMDAVLKPHGLLYSEFDALATLRRSGAPYELTPTELQEAVVLTSGAITALLNRLTKQGLITRRKSAEDGRSLTARLTPKGLRLTNKLIALRFDDASDAISSLSARDQAQITRLLKSLGDSLDS